MPTRLLDRLRYADFRLYQTLRSSFGLVKHERKARSRVPWRRRVDMWRRGFFAESAAIYDLPRNDPRDYLSDFQHFVRCNRINAWSGFYHHKLVLRSFLLATGLRQAETVAVLLDPERILLDPYGANPGYVGPAQLLEHLRAGGEQGYVVKPEGGWCGEEIFLLQWREGGFVRQRGRDIVPFDYGAFVREWQANAAAKGRRISPTLVERRLQQGAFWAALFPDSANTIRALTLWTPGERAPFLARAVQRLGTRDTVPTDNWSGGGISAPIDPATGRLGEGRMHPLKGRRSTTRFTHHPDTGTPIAGATLPHWPAIRATVLRAAASLPFNRMAGWDVLVDPSGTPVILEANGNSDVNLLQVHGGLLRDPRIRRFYQACGVV